MTPLPLKISLTIIELVAAGWIFWRYPSQRHPAFTALALCEVGAQLLKFAGLSGSILFLITARYAASLESGNYSRLCISRPAFARAMALILAASAAAASLPADLSPVQRQYLFRQYATLAVCLWQWAVVVYRWRRPVLECRRHRVYRIGLALWYTPIAIAGTFVPGGVGYMLFSYTRRTWMVVELATYVSMLLIALLAIVALMPGRKRAAVWAGKGRVVVGRIEQEAA